MSPILALVRPDILELQPYQHATWDPSLERLHANEMPWRAQGDNTAAGLNRYPEPQPKSLVERMCARLFTMTQLMWAAPSLQVEQSRVSDVQQRCMVLRSAAQRMNSIPQSR